MYIYMYIYIYIYIYNVFGYEDELAFPIYVSDQNFEDSMGLLLFIVMTSHIMCTLKVLTDLCFTKPEINTKKAFVKVVYSVLVAKMC